MEKQGYEIALALSKNWYKNNFVYRTLETKFAKGLTIKKVKTADEMFNQVKKLLPVDIAVCAAAVSDFKGQRI